MYFGYRYHDPETGRWLSRDPIQEYGGLNIYGYVGNNPIDYIDPLGLGFRDGNNWFHDWVAEQIVATGPDTVPALDVFTESVSDQVDSIEGTFKDVFTGDWSNIQHRYDSGPPGQSVNADPFTKYGTRCALGISGVAATTAIGAIVAESFGATDSMVTVSRWGREGLQPGDWVMKGPKNYWNYLRTGKWEPNWLGTNEYAPFNSGESYVVPKSSLKWPSNWWGWDGKWKGAFGQRIYEP